MNLNKKFTMAVAVMATIATAAADFNFPSSGIPGGYSNGEVEQYVSFIWDDNGYSGEVGTQFEPAPPTEPNYANSGFVGRKADGNGVKINEGDMGISWAVRTLAAGKHGSAPEDWNGQSGAGPFVVNHNGRSWKNSYWVEATDVPGTAGVWADQGPAQADVPSTRSNPDGSDIHMTFNMISGLFIPTYGPSWKDRQSEYGSYKDPSAEHTAIAIAWGREYQIGTSKGGSETQPSYMIAGVKKMIAAGHEIGNHTIDHIETNSPLPASMWPGGQTWENGFDDGRGENALGEKWSEQAEFGTAPNGYALTHGWQFYAGKQLKVETWKGIISLGEVDGPKQGVTDKLVGFRAPRLEVNSAMFFALKEKGYLYDCGNEEGYEDNRTGENFVWPYTTDNGTPNAWTQKEFGEHIYIDSMPAGLWQYPVNVMVVPENIRAEVFKNAKQVADAEGEDIGSVDEWNGTVTGFDFNMFILWGMTGDNVLATLKNTLDLRMKGNKAPMHIGCHTDYFTPIYDNATLLSAANKNTYGLCVTEGWNSWDTRKATWESFTDYAIGKGAYFKSARETIEYVQSLIDNPKVTFKDDQYDLITTWEVDTDEASVTGDPTKGYTATFENDSAYVEFSHEFDTPATMNFFRSNYNISQAVRVVVTLEDGTSVGILLNSLKIDVDSKDIPLYQFERDAYDADQSPVNYNQKVVSISIIPQHAPSKNRAAVTESGTLKEIRYGNEDASPISTINTKTLVKTNMRVVNHALKLNVKTSGIYSVKIVDIRGRVIQDLNVSLLTGMNTVNFNDLARGTYIVQVKGAGFFGAMKSVFR